MSGFEPEASYMRSKRSTTELHPQLTMWWPSFALYENPCCISIIGSIFKSSSDI